MYEDSREEIMNSTYKAFWLEAGDLVVIDQTQLPFRSVTKTCLLYTSDAADE